jgi:hypothetical protein
MVYLNNAVMLCVNVTAPEICLCTFFASHKHDITDGKPRDSLALHHINMPK